MMGELALGTGGSRCLYGLYCPPPPRCACVSNSSQFRHLLPWWRLIEVISMCHCEVCKCCATAL